MAHIRGEVKLRPLFSVLLSLIVAHSQNNASQKAVLSLSFSACQASACLAPLKTKKYQDEPCYARNLEPPQSMRQHGHTQLT